MTIAELFALLKSTGYPVSFSHFKNQTPSIPYIIYTTPSDSISHADNTNYFKMIDVDIELYTDKKDLQAEETIENLLDENGITYTPYQVFIESEGLHMKTYEIRI